MRVDSFSASHLVRPEAHELRPELVRHEQIPGPTSLGDLAAEADAESWHPAGEEDVTDVEADDLCQPKPGPKGE